MNEFQGICESYMREKFLAEKTRKERDTAFRPKGWPLIRNTVEIIYDVQFHDYSRKAAALKRRAFRMLRGDAA